MDYRASHKNASIPPRKARYVVDMVRGKDVNEAFEILTFTNKRASGFVKKILASAVANASAAAGVNVNKLFIREARVDGGPAIQTVPMPGPMGRALPVRRRLSHIHLVLTERDAQAKEAVAAQAPAKAKSEAKSTKKESKGSAVSAKSKKK